MSERTPAEARFWTTWGAWLDHGARCMPCRTTQCSAGARLERAHGDAKGQLSAERTAAG